MAWFYQSWRHKLSLSIFELLAVLVFIKSCVLSLSSELMAVKGVIDCFITIINYYIIIIIIIIIYHYHYRFFTIITTIITIIIIIIINYDR